MDWELIFLFIYKILLWECVFNFEVIVVFYYKVLCMEEIIIYYCVDSKILMLEGNLFCDVN